MNTRLVMMGDYDCSQAGYNDALTDGAVYPVNIDEASYSALYNVQIAVQATCDCRQINVCLGLVRDNKYIPLSVVEDSAISPDLDYGDLESAFDLGLIHLEKKSETLAHLRANVDEALNEFMTALPECGERERIDHCITVIENN